MKVRSVYLRGTKWLTCMLAASLILIAGTSVASACGGWTYQPKVPKALQK